MNHSKDNLAEHTNTELEKGLLEDVIKKADVFIGVSKGNVLKGNEILTMNKNPIVFALANPVP
jgi:malate dehydrogenase (oxaloacetate-decarboxylating)